MYVFETNSARMTTLYYELCNNRLEGIVYIDTTGVFKRRNTHIPKNKLFHTFVMRNDGKVLLVGNPFTNERMKCPSGSTSYKLDEEVTVPAPEHTYEN